jgi:phosphomannomutase/phosphoglucomutase
MQNIPAQIFKAYDIRGIVGKTLTPDIVELIGHAIGSEAVARGQKTIAIGRDGRLSGPELLAALARGIVKSGIDVIDVGAVATPMVYFAAFHLQTDCAVMLTGSHNPPDYNGLKIVLAGQTLSGEDIQALRVRIEQNDLSHGAGNYSQQDIGPAYLSRIVSDIKLARPMKISIDCGNGIGGAYAADLYRQLGCEVEELYCEVDGNFPNHHPDPSVPANLQDLIAALQDNDSELGLAFDGDADRLGVVTTGHGKISAPDNKARHARSLSPVPPLPAGEEYSSSLRDFHINESQIIYPDRLLMLFAADMLSRNPGAEVIFDIKSTRQLFNWIRGHGGIPTIWKTGHSLIKAKMRETGALLAAEMTGHFFFVERWYGFDDGLYAGARLLEILSRVANPSDTLNALPDAYSTPELHIHTAEDENHTLIATLKKSGEFTNTKEIITLDGIRAEYADGFGLARPSNTTPAIVLRFEADKEIALKRIQDDFRRVFQLAAPHLTLPF